VSGTNLAHSPTGLLVVARNVASTMGTTLEWVLEHVDVI
jgi:hypothetical protein